MSTFFHGKAELKDTGHCFVSLPSKWNLNKNFAANQFNLSILKIIFLDDLKCDRYIYVSWNGVRNARSDYVVFDRQFAAKLGLTSGESILVQSVDDAGAKLAQCISLDIRPLTDDDYQLISVNSSEIESVLLDQLRVITTAFCREDEPLKFNIVPIWLRSSANVPIFVEIVNFEPKSGGHSGLVLVDSTKLVIHSPEEKFSFNQNNSSSAKVDDKQSPGYLKSVFGMIPFLSNTSTSNTLPENNMASNKENGAFKSIPFYKGQPLMLRILPHLSKEPDNTIPICTAFISHLHFEQFSLPEKYCIVKLQKVYTVLEKLDKAKKKQDQPPQSSPLKVDTLAPEERYLAQFTDKRLRTHEEIDSFPLLIFPSTAVPLGAIQLNKCLRLQVNLPATSYVHLTAVTSPSLFTSQKVVTFSSSEYLSVPVAPQLTLIPLNGNRVAGKIESWTEELKNEVKKQISDSTEIHNTLSHHLFLSNGTLLKLGDTLFIVYYSEIQAQSSVDLERVNWTKLLNGCFLVDANTIISVKQVTTIKADTTSLLKSCCSRSVQELDSTHLKLLYREDSKVPFGGYSRQFDRCDAFLKEALHLKTENEKPCFVSGSCLLLTGAKGAGKTALIDRLTSVFIRENYVYLRLIKCDRELRGKRLESLQKTLLNALQEAIQRQPSVLVLEDLDEVAFQPETDEKSSPESESAPANGNENVPLESVYVERVATVVLRLLQTLHKLKTSSETFSQVAILATAKSVSVLNRILVRAINTGEDGFDEVVDLETPDVKSRGEIIECILKAKDLSIPGSSNQKLVPSVEFNISRLARATKGYTPEDLTRLLDIVLHQALMSSLSSNTPLEQSLPLTEEHITSALSAYTPLYRLANGNQPSNQINSKRRLEDVGGMSAAKQHLLDTILLPSRYPKLFEALPLKAANSVLLYGAPGTGKTMLVEAVAAEASGLAFIGIKGPELLSKYIGASEGALRSLFARAAAAAPCILFFDEFDALAPRRGHDSTGVTDRLVNQLLTLLDGLEERRRDVYIVAATSRPDLIDLALLRPGRFDKCVLVTLPNEHEKVHILEALSKKLKVDLKTVDWRKVAGSEQTEGFTGADLQALLYTAYLRACKRRAAFEEQVIIKGEDVEGALKQTSPSLSKTERAKFEAIYGRFVRELSGQFVPSGRQQLKATLA